MEIDVGAPSIRVPRIFGAPPPLLQECFSSWLVRVANRSRLRLSALSIYFPIPKGNLAVLDFSRIPAGDLDLASIVTMNPIEAIAALVDPYVPILDDPTYRCLTTFDGQFIPLVRYCPRCWGADSVAYVRRAWRLAFTHVCRSHNQVLLDRCWHCGRHLELTLDRYEGNPDNPLRYCWYCQADLAEANDRSLPETHWRQLSSMQEHQFSVLLAGWYRHPTLGTISSAMYIENHLNLEGEGDEMKSWKFSYDLARSIGSPIAMIIQSAREG